MLVAFVPFVGIYFLYSKLGINQAILEMVSLLGIFYLSYALIVRVTELKKS